MHVSPTASAPTLGISLSVKMIAEDADWLAAWEAATGVIGVELITPLMCKQWCRGVRVAQFVL